MPESEVLHEDFLLNGTLDFPGYIISARAILSLQKHDLTSSYAALMQILKEHDDIINLHAAEKYDTKNQTFNTILFKLHKRWCVRTFQHYLA